MDKLEKVYIMFLTCGELCLYLWKECITILLSMDLFTSCELVVIWLLFHVEHDWGYLAGCFLIAVPRETVVLSLECQMCLFGRRIFTIDEREFLGANMKRYTT